MFLNTEIRAIRGPMAPACLPAPSTTLNWTRVSDLADDGTLDFFVDVEWTPITGEAEYALKIVNTTDGTTSFKRVDNALTGGKGKYRLPATSGKASTVSVRAIGADGGTPSDWSTASSITVTKKNTAPTTPAGLTAVDGNKLTRLAWAKSPDGDFKRTIIYGSTTNNFTTPPAAEVGRTAVMWLPSSEAPAHRLGSDLGVKFRVWYEIGRFCFFH
jgi:hypothetical protein